MKTVYENDQKTPQSQKVDKPSAPRGRDTGTLTVQDMRTTIK